MMRHKFFAGVLTVTVVLASCGSDNAASDDSVAGLSVPEPVAATTVEASAPEQTTTIETTPPVITPAETTPPEPTPYSADPIEGARAAWSLVFDSNVPFDNKAPHLADAGALRPTVEAYSAAGAGFGGINLAPTAVDVSGESAAITYDVNFGVNPAYSDQSGTVDLIDGVWTVSRDEFCSFMASARVSCP